MRIIIEKDMTKIETEKQYEVMCKRIEAYEQSV
jgi:hypothetical protein